MSIVEDIAEFTMRTQTTIQQLIQERDYLRAENAKLKDELNAVRNPDNTKEKK